MTVQQKVRVPIPRGYKPKQRQEIGDLIVDFIVDRSRRYSLDKKDNRLGAYSKEYAEEKGTKKVNLTDTGDMLDSLKVLKTYTTYITIGYKKDYDGHGKVEGNRKGTYGNKKQVAPKRDFLGLTAEDIADILKSYGTPPDDYEARFQELISKEVEGLTPKQLERLEEQFKALNKVI